MKTNTISNYKPTSKIPLLLVVGAGFFWLGGHAPYAYAQSPADVSPDVTNVTTNITTTTTTTTTTASTSEIAAMEADLKQKRQDLEKLQLNLEKSKALELQQAKLEVEVRKLELLKARRDLLVQETVEQLAMQVQTDVLFDVGKYEIKSSAEPTLKQVALILAEYPQGKVIVTGFADSTGTSQDNLELSRKRGEAVKTYLLEKSGISSERIVAKGMGEAKPVATNLSATGRQLNRRVEITVTKSLAP